MKGVFCLIIRKSHFMSICLMALASSIAITEYVMYSPTTLPENIEDDPFSKDTDTEETSDDSEFESSASDDSEASQIESSEKDSSIDGSKTIINQTDSSDSDPFKTSGEKEVIINSGDTLASVVGNLGFDKTDIYLASKALSKVFNLRNLKIGQIVIVRGKRDQSEELVLTGLEIRQGYRYKIIVSRTDSGFSAEKTEIPIKKVVRSISGKISPKSPDYSLKQCGVKPQVSAEALRSLSQIVNIRNSRSPIDFEFLYRDFYDDSGNIVKKPELLYASVFIDGKIKRIYKFSDDGSSEYIDSNGTILRTLAKSRSMLNQPLNRMKVTSKFGIRRHPISGKIKGHTGVDLSAPIGTPIRAAASGKIMRASHYSGYGRYINIKHTGSLNTAYGHLSRIVVRNGQQVSQGQIIGYTGNSGYSTGPHLHYEVIKQGSPINPMSFVKQEPQKLTGQKLRKFNQFKKEVNLQVVGLMPSQKNKTAKVKKYS